MATQNTQQDKQMVAYVQQLVKAANSEDEKTAKEAQTQINIILKAYPILSELAKRAQEGEDETAMAKYGAKLNYLDSLIKGVPEGYDVEYHRNGGNVTKTVVKKETPKAKTQEPAKKSNKEVTYFDKKGGKTATCAKCGKPMAKCKCGGKAAKRYFGGIL